MESSVNHNGDDGAAAAGAVRPLCVDVDGTLLKTDLLIESFLALLKQRPLDAFRAPFWLLRGKACLKENIASRVVIDLQLLPVRGEVLDFIREEQEKGRPIYLASASHASLVSPLAEQIGGLSGVFATSDTRNLSGRKKAEQLAETFGEKGFDYIGNEAVDFPVWKRARLASAVASGPAFEAKVRKAFDVDRVFPGERPTWKSLAKAMRIHQWAKNLLIFVPLVTAHRIFDVHALLMAVAAFLSFGFVASGVYVLNDLLDLDADRRHHRKRYRPWASGELPLKFSLLLLPLLFGLGIAVGMSLPWKFIAILAIYCVTTSLYSFRLKQVVLVDIIVLASLYTIRIIAGGAACGIAVSQWLLGLSMFLFFSLACVKRFSELHNLRVRSETKTHGRGYEVEDMDQIAIFGASSGYMSALVLALYVNSREVQALYTYPRFILLACPLVLYWISRVWLLARRGLVHEDPLVFALRDKVTYLVMALTVAAFVTAL